jgi:nitroreductase
MTRAFRPDPIQREVIEELVDLASRAPSAGKTQGWHLLVLEGAETDVFWSVSLPEERRTGFAWPQLLDAPIIALVLSDPDAYLARYREPDKAATGLGEAAERWPAPFWTIDAAMAAMTLLLAAEDRGLGALLFGVFHNEAAVRHALRIPDSLEIVAAIALGLPESSPPGRSASRRRRTPDEIIQWGRWGSAGSTA